MKFACIGSATAETLASCGISADLVPEAYDSEHLADALCREMQGGGAALLLRLLVSIIVMLSLGGWDAFPAVLWTCLPHILAYAVLIAGGIFFARWLKKRGEKHDDL